MNLHFHKESPLPSFNDAKHVLTIETGVPLIQNIPDMSATESTPQTCAIGTRMERKRCDSYVVFAYGLGSGIIIQLAVFGILQLWSVWFQKAQLGEVQDANEDHYHHHDHHVPWFEFLSYWMSCIVSSTAFYLFFVSLFEFRSWHSTQYQNETKYDTELLDDTEDTERVIDYHFTFGFGSMVSCQYV